VCCAVWCVQSVTVLFPSLLLPSAAQPPGMRVHPMTEITQTFKSIQSWAAQHLSAAHNRMIEVASHQLHSIASQRSTHSCIVLHVLRRWSWVALSRTAIRRCVF
jgi:hypothetical protein